MGKCVGGVSRPPSLKHMEGARRAKEREGARSAVQKEGGGRLSPRAGTRKNKLKSGKHKMRRGWWMGERGAKREPTGLRSGRWLHGKSAPARADQGRRRGRLHTAQTGRRFQAERCASRRPPPPDCGGRWLTRQAAR